MHSQMSKPFSKLESMFAINVVKKRSILGYLMIIVKTLMGLYECVGMSLKLKVSDNRKSQ